jgi:hypothetical protein
MEPLDSEADSGRPHDQVGVDGAGWSALEHNA